jgi:hypothetical protein
LTKVEGKGIENEVEKAHIGTAIQMAKSTVDRATDDIIQLFVVPSSSAADK